MLWSCNILDLLSHCFTDSFNKHLLRLNFVPNSTAFLLSKSHNRLVKMSLKFSGDATFTKNFPQQLLCLSELLELLLLLDCKELKLKKSKATLKVFCSHSIRSKLSILITFLPCPETNTFNRLSGSIYAGVLKECVWWNFFSPKFKALFYISEIPRIINHFK